MVIDNVIHIKGGAYREVKKILKQWIVLYKKQLPETFKLELFKNGRANHLVRVPKHIEDELFYYLVNYIIYPTNVNIHTEVTGYCYCKTGRLKGQRLMVYIPKSDKHYDCVYVVDILAIKIIELNLMGK